MGFISLDELEQGQQQTSGADAKPSEPTGFVPIERERSWGEAAKDTAVQLAEGVNTIAGAVPNLVAPEGNVAGFFRENADFWRDKQSDPLKKKMARADEAITAAGEDGVIAQVAAAASQYFSDPALAARFVVTNLPSMIPGIGAAKLTQAAALAKGASLARAAQVATTAAGATNAVLNAGGARGEAFEDIKRTLVQQGYTVREAEELAIKDSRVVAAVGGLTGFISGKTGLEGSIVGKAGAGSAVRAGGRAFVAELAGEQLEEVTPKVTTNVQASRYDGRSIGKDVGRTIVETGIGSGPGAVVAGGTTGLNVIRSQPGAQQAGTPTGSAAQAGAPADGSAGFTPVASEPSGSASISEAVQPAPPTAPKVEAPAPLDVRLAELELLAQSRDLTDQELTEAQDLVRQLDEADPLGDQPGMTGPGEEAIPGADELDPLSAASPEPAESQGASDAGPEVLSEGPMAPVLAEPGLASVDVEQVTQSQPDPALQQQPGADATPVPEQSSNPDRIGFTALTDQSVSQSSMSLSGPAGQVQAAPTVQALQNRDRSRAASVAQMADIARNPDYMRLATSRTPDAGAPMVFAVGDELVKIPQGNGGRTDVAVMSDGQRVPFRYAVVDASTVEPSNFVDGQSNPAFSANVIGTLKALNNGRTAGLRAAYEEGTAEQYRAELIADAQAHGVPLEAIQRTPNPILVRVYSEQSNTPDMAAKSQSQGLGMSPAELAVQDAVLIDSGALAVLQPGDLSSAANRDFVRAFIGRVQQAGQDVAGMMTADGTLSPAGRQRMQAALMQAAYGDAELVGELFDSLDTDIKSIGEALKAVAGEWANLRDSARQGVINPAADITDNLMQAVNLVRRARRDRTSLYDLTRQPDLMTGQTPDPITVGALRMFYGGSYFARALGRDAMMGMLRDYARSAMATTAGADMFGDQVTPGQILAGFENQGVLNAQDRAQDRGRAPDGGQVAVRGPDAAREPAERYGGDEGSAGAVRSGRSGTVESASASQRSDTGGQPDAVAQPVTADLDALRREALPIARTGAFAKKGLSFEERGQQTAVMFKGQEVARFEGARSRPNIVKAIQAAIAASAPEAADLSGQKIDRNWTQFSQDSGSLGIPRAEMPQIHAEHRGALVQFLKGRGVVHGAESDVDPATLKPTQAEFSPAKVKKAKGFEGGDRAILVSGDGYVLDGHHQWMAKREQGQAIRVIRFDAPIRDLLPLAREFPSSTQAAGASQPAAQAPRAKAAKAPAAEAKPAEARIADVGEQLYANRRNFTGRGLKWDDVQGLNDTLKLKEVTKAKVWPRPDYEQLVTDGMPPVVARLVKQVYDGISAGPTVRSGTPPTDADLQRYIDTLSKVREGLFSFVKDRQRVAAFAQGVLATIKRDASAIGPVSVIDLARETMDPQGVATVLLRQVWPDQFADGVPTMGRFRRGSDAHQDLAIIGGNKALAAMQFTRPDLSKWVADLGKGWPAKREAWQVQGYRVLGPDEYVLDRYDGARGTLHYIRPVQGRGSWSRAEPFTGNKFALVLDSGSFAQEFDTREAAIEAAREKVKRSTSGGQDIRGTNIAEAERVGPARRQDGEDVTPQGLMDTFGFRGVNFGREGWIKQAERQEYLNQAYDGLLDLAEILGVPPKAMSLNGKLGIAFGAQGKGKFAAHFVPGYNEINLTKTKGAGTLAHEWGHGFDHYFATLAGLEKDAEPFLSEHANKGDTTDRMVFEDGRYVSKKGIPTFGDGIRPEIVRAFRSIYQAMEKRNESPGEAQARRTMAKESAAKRLKQWLRVARSKIEDSAASNKADLLAEFDQHAEKLEQGDTGDGYQQAGKQVFSTRVAAVRNLIKDATGRVWSLDESNGLEASASYVRSLAGKEDADATHEPQKVSSQYKRDSMAMDREKGGKAYWSTPTEMFARAFELYVHDKLSQRGQRNTFLTDAEQRAATPVQVDDTTSAMGRASGAKRDLYLYPVGQERQTLREAFDSLIGQIQTRETEQGVAMFNRKDDTYTDQNGTDTQPTAQDLADIEALEAIVDDGNRGAIDAGRSRRARDVRPFRWVRLPDGDGLAGIAAAFGKRVVGFDVPAGVLTREFGFFNGVTRPGRDNRIFINAKSDRPQLAVLGHEMGHQLKRQRPDLYDDLVAAIRPYVRAKEYGTEFAASSVARFSYPQGATAEQRDAAVREEFVGEILSDGFMDKGFWRAVGDHNPSLLQSLVGFIGGLIDQIKAAVGYAPRTARYLTDFDRVMQIAGQVMAEYGLDSATARMDSTADGAPRFQRNDQDDQTQPSTEQQNVWTRAKAKVQELTSPAAIDRLLYEFQDKLIDLRRLRDHIKALGGTVTDLNDAYLGEELYHKRLAKRTADFLDKELKPLLGELRARAVSLPEFEQYLHARHAPEANKVLAQRNPNRTILEANRQKAAKAVRDLETQLQRAKTLGSATTAIEEALQLAREDAAMWRGAQAFIGTEDERLALSGMSDAQAKAFMDALAPRKRQHMQELAAMVDKIQAKTLDDLEAYGLMDKATLNAWRSSYQFYVPLHRDEARPESDRHPIGQGFSVKGTGVKSRVGSNEKVTNILAHIAMQREAVLTRGEKNNVVKKLYLMAAQNPDDEFWVLDAPPRVKTVDPRNGTVRTTIDPTYKHRPNVVMVRIAGRDKAIVFNEHNPSAVRLAESMKNLDIGDLHVVLGLAAKGTRWFASVNTQYNPIFGLINFARDVQAGLLNLSTTPLAGKQKDVAKHVMTAIRAIYRQRRGKASRNGQWTALWEEFENVGGTTGYRDLFSDADDRAKALVRDLQALDRGQVSKAAHAVVDWLSDYNEVMENAVRLAAYKVATDQGMSKEQAASLAKNLTVNFNRKGRQTRELGALYAFFNAALQGTTRMVETLRGPIGKRIMYGGVALGAINALIGMAMMGAGDDDEADNWEKIPEFVKERSIVIPLGREDYLTIPMPLGFHVFPNIGRLAVEFAFGDDQKSLGSRLGDMLSILVDAFNPLGGAQNLGQMVSPTVIDPVVALMQNRDWTGRPIYREDFSDLDPTPGFTRTKDSASSASRAMAEAINTITGGSEYRPGAWSPTPDQIDYVFGQLTGGLGRELIKVNQTLTSAVTGDELPPYKVPLMGRLYGNTRGTAGQSEQYYENLRQINEAERELKGRQRKGDAAEDFMQREPMTGVISLANQVDRRIRELRKERSELVEDKGPGYQTWVRDIDMRIAQAMAELNNEVTRVRREAAK
ncbi:LPD38 domain-containing protein [Hydrogenophaga sp.]|uniref:LPD38 domain-containing protein n=1 Tax=Hydrogenophaga sp. TaxID=1904254 RepID=UPI0035AFB788